MGHDLNDHPFSPQSVARESGVPDRSERAWLAWVATAEKLIGVKLACCDELEDGCSLDFAFDAFEQGITAIIYAETACEVRDVLAARRAKGG